MGGGARVAKWPSYAYEVSCGSPKYAGTDPKRITGKMEGHEAALRKWAQGTSGRSMRLAE